MAVTLVVKWTTNYTNNALFKLQLGKLAILSRKEQGCIKYEVLQDVDDLFFNTYILIEKYVNEAALQEHVNSDHYKWLVKDLESLAVFDADVIKLKPVGADVNEKPVDMG